MFGKICFHFGIHFKFCKTKQNKRIIPNVISLSLVNILYQPNVST